MPPIPKSLIPSPDTWRWLLALFGPPRVTLREAYGENSGTGTFNHGALDDLLRRCVDGAGFVDYAGLARYAGLLDGYLSRVAAVDFAGLARDEKLALLINVYNAATLRLILDHMPVASIRDIPAKARWTARRWTVGGKTMSLADIENVELRAKFDEPRIHFAINCASIGCPKLRNAAFTGPSIDAELAAHTRDVHTGARWLHATPDGYALSKIYRWYEGDFVQSANSVQNFAARYAPEIAGKPQRGWLAYDWSLNSA
ncbi:MAG: DUF547 domain-containing protein [Rhodospirillaceae bacterium]|jgi:hypothetical protein|nr:DUF547 domain-containing protein [Rhodospirillaceae bacterium]MBT3809580.1 DUF547 domain-containing protein [Rhodospirillaceae bacterium]MBT4773153.1 DUF547 domain-containing protein [Rhodospirillaceae bacterium]MBT5358333.1 DUF547 domain-containing protein [Rhodospirillaceae bacterium]MBT5771083.1 DUF547 domain-containing protein [Rhodospirillaceae bacterium]